MPCKHLLVMWILVFIGSDVSVLGYSTVRLGISTTIDYDLADFDEIGKDPGNVDTVNIGSSSNYGSDGVLNPQTELGYGLDGGGRHLPGGYRGGGQDGGYMDPVSDEDIASPNASTEDQTPATISLTPDNDDNMDAGSTMQTEPTSDPDPDYDDYTRSINNNAGPLSLTSTQASIDLTSASTITGTLGNTTKNPKVGEHNTGWDYNKSDKDGGSTEISTEQISGQSNGNSSYISRRDSITGNSDDENNPTTNIDFISDGASKYDDLNNSKPVSEDNSVDNPKSSSNLNEISRNDDSSSDSNSGSSGPQITNDSSDNNNTSGRDPDTPDDIDNDSNSNKNDVSDSNGTNENNDAIGTNMDIDNDSDTVSMEMKSISFDHVEKDSKITSSKVQAVPKDDNSLSSCFNWGNEAEVCQLAISLYEICNSQFTDKCTSNNQQDQNTMQSGTKSDSDANDPTNSLTVESLHSFSTSYDKASGMMEILNMIKNMCPGLCSIAKSTKYVNNTINQPDQSNSDTAETSNMYNHINNDVDNDTSIDDSMEDICADDADDNGLGESDSTDLDYTLNGFYSDDSNNDLNNNSPYNIDQSSSDQSSDVTNVPNHYSATVQSAISGNSGANDQSYEST